MKVTLLPAEANLIEAVVSAMGDTAAGQDLSDTVVVFPGKRLAHFLRKALARTRGGGFIPPHIVSMDELVDEIFERREGEAKPKLETIDLVALLYEIQCRSSDTWLPGMAPHVFGGESFMSLDGFFSLGMKISTDLEELCIEGVEPRLVGEMQTLIEEEVPLGSRERLATLRHFYEALYETVERRGFSTRATRYRAVGSTLAPGDLGNVRTVILAGLYAFTRAERGMLSHMSDWPAVRCIFKDGPGMREVLESLGREATVQEATGAPADGPHPAVHLHRSPDAHGQVFELNALIEEPDERTAIILPSVETLFPLLRSCLSRFREEEYNVSLGYPLHRTPMHGFLSNLMELISSMEGERIYMPDYLRFVLHPYTKNILFKGSAEPTRVLFHALEDRLTATRTRLFLTLPDIEAHTGLFQDAAAGLGLEANEAADLGRHLHAIHESTISKVRSFSSVRDFAERCIDLISYVQRESTASSHPLFTPFAEAFVRSLETLSRSLLAPMAFSGTSGYFTLFRRYLRTCHVPFPGTPLRGMQVLGTLETRGLAFEKVFVLDANEGTFPRAVDDDSLLPFAVRKALGLPTARERERTEAYHFELMRRGARELHLFFVENGGKERSRFVERLLWDAQKKAGTVETAGLVTPIQYRVNLETRPPSPVAKTPEMLALLSRLTFSASALDQYLSCPLAFYHARVLGLGKREEPSGEIERTDIGLLVHAILSRYFRERTHRPLAPADADPAAMDAITEELFTEKYGAADAGAERLLKLQIRSRLRDFLTDYLAPLISGHSLKVLDVERTLTAARNGFSLKGRLDAVWELDGIPWIVDFKTSSNPCRYQLRADRLDPAARETWGEALGSVQLPLYLMLWAGAEGIRPEEANAMVLLLGRATLDAGSEVRLFPDRHAAERDVPKLTAVLGGLLEEIVAPEVPFAPAANRKTSCLYCDFNGLCGRP